MLRRAFLVGGLVLGLATPAQAACERAGTTLSVSFEGAATLSVDAGAIRVSGQTCSGDPTVVNVDTILVTGGSGFDVLTVSLAGGPFAPGPTPEDDGSSEIEIGYGPGEQPTGDVQPTTLVVEGSAGPDHITLGSNRVNLNGDEAGDPDADLIGSGGGWIRIDGGDGGDELASTGTGEIGWDDEYVSGNSHSVLRGQEGDDGLSVAGIGRPGPGDDYVSFDDREFSSAVLDYSEAAGPATLRLSEGTTEPGKDGDGGTDTFGYPALNVHGSAFDDTIHSSALQAPPGGDTIRGGDGDDTIFGVAGSQSLHGDDGDDELHGGEFGDYLDGGAGDDELHGDDDRDYLVGGEDDDVAFGGAGNDDFLASVGRYGWDFVPEGADVYHGQSGADRMLYGHPDRFTSRAEGARGRSAPVAVTLDGVADDGAAGEGDNVMPDIEAVVGGLGDDTLIGNDGPNVLSGFGGGDTLRGHGGDDILRGEGTFEWLLTIFLIDDGDLLDGGAGNDVFRGEEGDDVIVARDRDAEDVNCGEGDDTGEADATDRFESCEGVRVPDPAPAPPDRGNPPSEPGPGPGTGLEPLPAPLPRAQLVPPPTLRSLVIQPSARRCVRGRRLTVRVRRAAQAGVRSVEARVDGRRRTRSAGRRLARPIDLRRLPRGAFRLTLRVTLADGRVVSGTRSYRSCVARRG